MHSAWGYGATLKRSEIFETFPEALNKETTIPTAEKENIIMLYDMANEVVSTFNTIVPGPFEIELGLAHIPYIVNVQEELVYKGQPYNKRLLCDFSLKGDFPCVINVSTHGDILKAMDIEGVQFGLCFRVQNKQCHCKVYMKADDDVKMFSTANHPISYSWKKRTHQPAGFVWSKC
jgi:hypothetical protein